MALKFFTVPVQDAEAAEAEVNAFLANHRILTVDRRWVDQGSSSFWAFCIDYLSGSPTSYDPPGRKSNRNRIDYKEVLSESEFALFAKLRDLRKEISQTEAVPVYTVFTNEQLAHMVQQQARSKADLEQIAGVGDARIEKYSERFLTLLCETNSEKSNEEDGEAV